MARLSRQPGENQESLFTPTELGSAPSDDFSEDVQLPPVSVDVSYRADEIGETLAALNRANRSAGFQSAAATPRRSELTQRYGNRVDEKVADASANESVHLQMARKHFARATGRDALIAAGYDANEASEDTTRMYGAFLAKYGVGIANAKIRNTAAKHLKDDATAIRKAPQTKHMSS